MDRISPLHAFQSKLFPLSTRKRRRLIAGKLPERKMEGGIIGPDFRQIYFVCEGQRAGTFLYTIKPKLSSYRKDIMFRGKIKIPFKNFLMGPNPKLTGNYFKFYGDR